jgi:molybdopterin-guanine dinucleotide biosynthesis protein A
MDNKYEDITGVILAGGRSTRMGRDKAFLRVGGVPLFQRVLKTLQALFEHVLIAGDRPDLALPDVPSFPDLYPGSALGGLYTGLVAAKTPYIFVAPCDMPYMEAELIRRMVDMREGVDVVTVRTPAGIEPCFSLYSKICKGPVREMLEKGIYRIDGFYPRVRVCYLDVMKLPSGWERSLRNINTPEDYDAILEKEE